MVVGWGLLEKCSVCIEEREWTRPESAILADVVTRETRPGLAGTQTLDSEWGRLEECVPKSASARTPEARELMDMHIRAAQWRRMVGTSDGWAAWCVAARRHSAQLVGAQLVLPQGADEEDATGMSLLPKLALSAADATAAVVDAAAGAVPLASNASSAGEATAMVSRDASKGVPLVPGGVDEEAAVRSSVEVALPAVKVSLLERFRGMAPKSAHAAYANFLHSESFDQRLLQEVRGQGGLPAEAVSPDYISAAGFLHEYLIGLIDRKEVDLGGMVANSRVPVGFARGRGSMEGNNCFISSIIQALLGKDLHGPEHHESCAKIRQAGLGTLWLANNFIEANPETLAFVTAHVLGKGQAVVCHLYSSYDGTTVSEVRCGDATTPAELWHVIHLFNPTGVHFDPLQRR